MKKTMIFLAAALATMLGCAMSAPTPNEETPAAVVPLDNEEAPIAPEGSMTLMAGGGGNVSYKGGFVYTQTPNVYIIWYGDWTSNPTATDVLPDLVANLSNTPHWKLVTTYHNGAGSFVPWTLNLAGQVWDSYSVPNWDGDSAPVMQNHIGVDLPDDPNGIYVILFSRDLGFLAGFCGTNCGVHGTRTINGTVHAAIRMGDQNLCPTACNGSPTGFNTPNGNVGTDSMAKTLVHELAETVTDKVIGTAWVDKQNQEIGTKCAWTFGPYQLDENGAAYTQTIGTRKYLLQQLWSNSPTFSKQKCASQL